jgi:hypothetical protein
MRAGRKVIGRLDEPERAVGGAFLEHEDIGYRALFARLGTRGVSGWSYEFPAENRVVEFLGSVDVLDGNLSPGDGARLDMVSGYGEFRGWEASCRSLSR